MRNRFRFGIAAVTLFVCGTIAGLFLAQSPSPEVSGAIAAVEPVRTPPPPRKLPPQDGKLRVICFGAHPDDCELKAAGVAALWSAKGHHVKFVSVTDGYIGHGREARGPLAKRRKTDVEKAGSILGLT